MCEPSGRYRRENTSPRLIKPRTMRFFNTSNYGVISIMSNPPCIANTHRPLLSYTPPLRANVRTHKTDSRAFFCVRRARNTHTLCHRHGHTHTHTRMRIMNDFCRRRPDGSLETVKTVQVPTYGSRDSRLSFNEKRKDPRTEIYYYILWG